MTAAVELVDVFQVEKAGPGDECTRAFALNRADIELSCFVCLARAKIRIKTRIWIEEGTPKSAFTRY
jgi:hypothetical protein